eukprot:3375159-Ditylum_brightwellii.AAC.1
MHGVIHNDTVDNRHNSAEQSSTPDDTLTNEDEKHDDEAGQEGKKSASEMQDDDDFTDGDYNDDNVSLNTQLMDDQNEFDNYDDDSGEDSVTSATRDCMDDEKIFAEKAVCDFSKDALAQIVNEVTSQKEVEIEQIDNKIHGMCATSLKDLTTKNGNYQSKSIECKDLLYDSQKKDHTQAFGEEGETSNKYEAGANKLNEEKVKNDENQNHDGMPLTSAATD